MTIQTKTTPRNGWIPSSKRLLRGDVIGNTLLAIGVGCGTFVVGSLAYMKINAPYVPPVTTWEDAYAPFRQMDTSDYIVHTVFSTWGGIGLGVAALIGLAAYLRKGD